jgi:hypothetical protein
MDIFEKKDTSFPYFFLSYILVAKSCLFLIISIIKIYCFITNKAAVLAAIDPIAAFAIVSVGSISNTFPK